MFLNLRYADKINQPFFCLDFKEIRKFGKEKNLDLAPEELTARWIAETGYRAERPNWFKRLISRIRLFLRQRGWFVHHLTDDDIASVLYRAARAGGRTDGVRMSTDDIDVEQAFPNISGNRPIRDILKPIIGIPIKNRETGDDALINENQIGKLVSLKAINKTITNGFTKKDHITAVANIKNLYENAVLLRERNDTKNADIAVKIKRFAAPLVIEKNGMPIIADALLTIKASLDKNSQRIYSLELDEIVARSTEGTQSGVRPDSGSRSNALTHEEYTSDDIINLQRKHEKIKAFLNKNGKSRQSVNPEEALRTKRLVDMMMPVVGSFIDQDGEYYAAKLKEAYNVDISPKEALAIAHEAIRVRRQAF